MSPSQSKPQLPKQTIRRQTNGGITPLSFGQQRIWRVRGASRIISEDLAADPAALRITGMYF